MAHRTNSDDDAHLLRLGHIQELHRQFSPLSMLGLAFAILNSWTALSASLSLSLPSGGPTSVIWGLVTAGVCNLCLAGSLAEFLSAWPTAGGQYHWVAMICRSNSGGAWERWMPLLTWVTGWINVAGWVALVATGGLLGSQLVVGAISFYHEDYEAERWHQFLIYVGYVLAAFLVNAFANRALPWVTKAGLMWLLAGFVVICVTVLACASPDYQSGGFVYRKFINETGWPDGLAWLLGLLQGSLGLTGFDAVAHMIEEIPNPSVEGPRIMIACVGIGVFTGFVLLSCLLFVVKDPEGAITSSSGPLLAIFLDATNSRAGSICLLIFPMLCLMFATISIMTTSSRMTYAFARDGGLPFSRIFAHVHPTFRLPLNALILTLTLVIIFGVLFIASSSALNAIVSASVVALGLSYGIPVFIHMLRGRDQLPTRPFALPGLFGWITNVIGVAYTALTTVLFLFPPMGGSMEVTAGNMNYCVVAFAVVILISVVQWFVDGRRNFQGPKGLEDIEPGVVVAEEEDLHGIGELEDKKVDEKVE